jgi:hypothetical protein
LALPAGMAQQGLWVSFVIAAVAALLKAQEFRREIPTVKWIGRAEPEVH